MKQMRYFVVFYQVGTDDFVSARWSGENDPTHRMSQRPKTVLSLEVEDAGRDLQPCPQFLVEKALGVLLHRGLTTQQKLDLAQHVPELKLTPHL